MKKNSSLKKQNIFFVLESIPKNLNVECVVIDEIQSRQKRNIKLLCRIDTIKELDYYRQGGILQYVLNSIIKKAS